MKIPSDMRVRITGTQPEVFEYVSDYAWNVFWDKFREVEDKTWVQAMNHVRAQAEAMLLYEMYGFLHKKYGPPHDVKHD